MNPNVSARFEITGWEETPYAENFEGFYLSKATVSKSFTGVFDGESTAELLTCQTDADDYSKGAGYVASERLTGLLEGRKGSFVIQHGGISGDGVDERSFGHVVPGSGTEELTGISGQVRIEQTSDGEHVMNLGYQIDGKKPSKGK